MLIMGFPDRKVSCIENPSFEGWTLLYTINDEIGVFQSSWGEIRKFNKEEVAKLIEENDKVWEEYWK